MYNKVFLIGNPTRDPEMRYTTAGIPVTKFSVAVNRRGKDEVDFFNIVTWRKLAEICGEFLSKGKKVSIEGRLEIDNYEKEGKQRVWAQIIADDVQILSRKDEENKTDSPSASVPTDEDIPF
jgi:single-strand DNA-binding protein